MKRILIIIAVTTILVPTTLLAHSGRTNSEGCHNNTKTGEYHCHNSKVAKTEAKSTARTTARTSAVSDRDCADFLTQLEAQTFYERNGGPFVDPHDLDRDGDGLACEALK